MVGRIPPAAGFSSGPSRSPSGSRTTRIVAGFHEDAWEDPGTPLLRAYLGDTVVFRLMHVMMNESHTWHLAGHAFRTERYAEKSDFKNAWHVGIAERYDL
jgi:FtsP/CotA-like multicopper oxidase with cupredoxin domain